MSSTQRVHLAGGSAYVSGLAALLTLVAIYFFSTAGQLQRTLYEVALLLQLLFMLPFIIVLQARFGSDSSGLKLLSERLALFLILFVTLLQVLIVSGAFGPRDFGQTMDMELTVTVAIGLWLLFSNYLGNETWTQNKALTWSATLSAAGYVLTPIVFRNGGQGSILIVIGLSLSMIGFAVWSVMLGRLLSSGNLRG